MHAEVTRLCRHVWEIRVFSQPGQCAANLDPWAFGCLVLLDSSDSRYGELRLGQVVEGAGFDSDGARAIRRALVAEGMLGVYQVRPDGRKRWFYGGDRQEGQAT